MELSVDRKLCFVLKLQVSPSLSPSLRNRLSSREVDYTNFYSDPSPLAFFIWMCIIVWKHNNLRLCCLKVDAT